MIKRFWVLMVALIGLLVLADPTAAQEGPIGAQHSDSGWQAWYWNNTSLAGSPTLQRGESELQHNWGLGSPDPSIGSDRFSARWTRYLDVPAGTYRITATSDDGIRVWVDGVLVINEWYDHGATSFSVTKELGSGHHLIVVEYYENEGEAQVNVSFDAGPTPIYNWRGEYFNNTSLSGSPVVVRDDGEINFDWGFGSPAPGPLGVDQFSVRWSRTVNLPPGSYRFSLTVDDGGRLWVNNHLLIDAWRVQAPTTYTGDIYLPGGDVPIRLEYFEQDGGAVARLSWAGGSSQPPQPPQPPEPPSGWLGEYFPNRSLSQSPALVRVDGEISFDWGQGAPAPGFPADNFSVRWTRDVSLPGGNYIFYARHDDGVRLWVDNQLVIDAWFDQAAAVHSGVIGLQRGVHRVRVEYYEHIDQASIAVWWDGSAQPPPPEPRPPDYGEIVVDNTDRGFLWGGPVRNRLSAPVGVGGSAYWTYNSVYYPVNFGKWIAHLPAAGNYEVYAYIPRDYGSSAHVRYRIMHNRGRHDRVINQGRYADQWVSLGTYYFDARNTGYEAVLVYDNTREPYTSRAIVFDAVKFVRR